MEDAPAAIRSQICHRSTWRKNGTLIRCVAPRESCLSMFGTKSLPWTWMNARVCDHVNLDDGICLVGFSMRGDALGCKTLPLDSVEFVEALHRTNTKLQSAVSPEDGQTSSRRVLSAMRLPRGNQLMIIQAMCLLNLQGKLVCRV